MICFQKKVWIFKITNFRPFCFNHNYWNREWQNENYRWKLDGSIGGLVAIRPSRNMFIFWFLSLWRRLNGENLTRFKIAAQTLMTFAGNFFIEEMKRQSRYNVVQIVVKTMTREPRQRYLKVKYTVPNKIDGRITVGMNGFIGSRCYTFVQTIFFLSFAQGYNVYSLSINTDKTNLLSWN